MAFITSCHICGTSTCNVRTCGECSNILASYHERGLEMPTSKAVKDLVEDAGKKRYEEEAERLFNICPTCGGGGGSSSPFGNIRL